jgi:hypothetical protein
MRGWRRAAERRRTMGTLLRAVALSMPAIRDLRQLRSTFEEELCKMLDARRVELRDGRPTPRPTDVSMSVQVAAGPLPLGAIDITLDGPETTLDLWDAQLVDEARAVAALILLLDRAYRAGTLAASRERFDGAAPIIGTSAAIRAVRERIDRVAAKNFTVLIEGPIGR